MDDKLTLNLGQFNTDELLSDWRWLVDDSFKPLMLTAMGDMFLTAPDGKVHMLNLMEGQFDAVAESEEEFQEKLADAEISGEWFLPEVAETNIDMGMTLKPNQCYGMKVPAFLNGKLEPENVEPIDVYVYYSITGQLLKQTKGLPQGTRIDAVKIPAPEKRLQKLWKKIFK